MSTPTPSSYSQKHPQPAIHHASTPGSLNHLGAFPSPAPRSVPSPAAHRNQAGKSPMNPSTSSAQNHPSTTASKTLLGSSPAALNYDSPSGLGLGLGNLAGLEGGVGMGISMSGMSSLGLPMGLTNSLGGRPDDTERRKRLETIVATLGTRPGRPTRENLLQLLRRLGIPVTGMSGDALVGEKALYLEVPFKDGVIDSKMLVGFHDACSQAVRDSAASASKVLNDDISPPPGLAAINVTLDKFSRNIERLFQMDRISTYKQNGEPDVHCAEAIAGVYTSLKRLFEHEKQTALTLIGASAADREEKAEREVLCKKSGRPRMNANRTIGLSLEYWMDRRHVFRSRRSTKEASDQEMDIDGDGDRATEDSNQIFSLTLECEPCSSQLYTPVRVSNEWISEKIELEQETTDPSDIWQTSIIDWRDPPPTYLEGGDGPQADPMALAGGSLSKLPDVRFVAKLNPPLVLPFSVAQQILASVGVQMQQEAVRWSMLEALVLKPTEDPSAMSADPLEYHAVKKVLVVGKDGQEREQLHSNTLFVQRTEYARVLDEIPFDHPRQLVQMLPILRQYAFLTSLLESSFGNPSTPNNPQISPNPDPMEPSRPVSMCITTTTPNPQLAITSPNAGTFSLPDSLDALLGFDVDAPQPNLGSYGLSILPNADVAVMEQDAWPELQAVNAADAGPAEESERKIKKLQRLGKALEMSGDAGLWVEWLEMMTSGQRL